MAVGSGSEDVAYFTMDGGSCGAEDALSTVGKDSQASSPPMNQSFGPKAKEVRCKWCRDPAATTCAWCKCPLCPNHICSPPSTAAREEGALVCPGCAMEGDSPSTGSLQKAGVGVSTSDAERHDGATPWPQNDKLDAPPQKAKKAPAPKSAPLHIPCWAPPHLRGVPPSLGEPRRPLQEDFGVPRADPFFYCAACEIWIGGPEFKPVPGTPAPLCPVCLEAGWSLRLKMRPFTEKIMSECPEIYF